MSLPLSRVLTPRVLTFAAAIGAAAVAALVVTTSLRATPAQAQSLMTAPACQCSAPTAVPALTTQVVHCLCGGMSCVLSQHSGTGASSNALQCVR